jgi:hypothetical protein
LKVIPTNDKINKNVIKIAASEKDWPVFCLTTSYTNNFLHLQKIVTMKKIAGLSFLGIAGIVKEAIFIYINFLKYKKN